MGTSYIDHCREGEEPEEILNLLIDDGHTDYS